MRDRVIAKTKLPLRTKDSPAAAKAQVVVAAGEQRTARASGFSVQLGVFRSRENAEGLLERLGARYQGARIVTDQDGSVAVFRVLSGNFPSAAAARTHALALKRAGFSTYVRTSTR